MRRPRPIALFTARLHSRTETRALAEDPVWSPIPVRILVSALVFLALAGLLAGCSLLAAQKTDPYAEIRQSWHEGFAMTDAALDALPFYSVTVRVDPAERTYTGTLNLRWPFTGTAPLSSLFFRTYPNLITFGGNLQVTGAGVNTINVPFRPAVDNTAVELVLPEPLQPGTTANIWLAFDGKLPDEGKVGEYTIFGTNEGVLSLTNFYPILASRRGDEWALDIPHPRGDVGFQEAGLYRAQVTLPPGEVTIATGMEVTHTTGADGWVTTEYALGPAREFSLISSPRFQVRETETLGTRVKSYFYPEDAEAGVSALYNDAAALRAYSDSFGPYPYREMSVVEAPLTFHGMEFPSVSLIGSQDYSRFSKDLETLVVHEVAHQWWYNQVGSDQVLSPWLDEGLAEYSMYDYMAKRYGPPAAEQMRALRWALPVKGLASAGADQPIGLPVREYIQNYETLVYAKGALFFATLRDEMGQEAFDRLLRTYLERYRWKVATPAEFQALAEEIAGRDLSALFNEWVGGSQGDQ
jgi:hypothetical protein